MRELQVDEFIDYTDVAAHEIVHDLDLAFDAVGSAETGRFLPTIKRGGAQFPIFPLGFDGQGEAEKLWRRGLVGTGSTRARDGCLFYAVALYDPLSGRILAVECRRDQAGLTTA